MKKTSLRNLLGSTAIIICNTIVLLTQQNKFASIMDEIISFVIIILISTILSGIIGGIIAPYTYKRVVLYVEAILGIIVLISGIIIYSIGQEVSSENNPFLFVTMIVVLVALVLAIIVGALVSSIGFFSGAFIGSKIGKSFTQNYTLENEEQIGVNDITFPSQM